MGNLVGCEVGFEVVGFDVGPVVGNAVALVGFEVGFVVGGLSHVVSPSGWQVPVVIPLLGIQLYCQMLVGFSIPQFIVELSPHISVPVLTVTNTSFHPSLA